MSTSASMKPSLPAGVIDIDEMMEGKEAHVSAYAADIYESYKTIDVRADRDRSIDDFSDWTGIEITVAVEVPIARPMLGTWGGLGGGEPHASPRDPCCPGSRQAPRHI